MKIVFVAWLLQHLIGANAFADVAATFDNTTSSLDGRHLQHLESFVPLSCNANLDTVACNPWTSVFGAADTYPQNLTIDCGTCVMMDHPTGASIVLAEGLHVNGKLTFPSDPTYQVSIDTPILSVQGKLEIKYPQAVTGTPNVEIVLSGSLEQTFTPIDENDAQCGGGDCSTGIRAMVVAGGTVDLQGMDPLSPAWVNLYDVTGVDQTTTGIVLPASVDSAWGIGSRIVVTSYTERFEHHQERTVVGKSSYSDPAYIVLDLDVAIDRPTTVLDDADYAVEVALLSRNILIRGDTTTGNALHGGHFWVFHTPLVQQSIVGLELVRMGQQGLLGRYPIHFHMCGNVAGSVVAKNSIHQSLQRCVVVHVTDNLEIVDNVAFDTKGHCYLLEDGIETGNSFRGNLGAWTQAPSVVIPDNGSNGIETDAQRPSTFWIPAYDNTFVSNVAAGAEDSGFWWEPRIRGVFASQYADVDPEKVLLREFRDNVAHSSPTGFRTYPAKALRAPNGSKNTLTGLKGYRNSREGIFIHLCRNLIITNSLFADNGIGVDIDRADMIDIVNTEIVGETAIFRQQRLDQGNGIVPPSCYIRRLIGTELHTFGMIEGISGHSVMGVTYSGFENTLCDDAVPFNFDDRIRSARFWGYSIVKDIAITDGMSDPFDLCMAKNNNAVAHIGDLDGSLSPAGSPFGTIVTNVDQMTHFLPVGACTEDASRCLSYCENECFRTVAWATPPVPFSKDFKLKVCPLSSPADCILTPSYSYIPPEKEGSAESTRYFAAHLPFGQWTVSFVDAGGFDTWPTVAAKDFQNDYRCVGDFGDEAVILYEPPVSLEYCSSLIANGDMELEEYHPWMFRFGESVVRDSTAGVGGSVALTVSDTSSTTKELTQYLDTRCLKLLEGLTVRVTANVKVTINGSAVTCDGANCPEVGFHLSNVHNTVTTRIRLTEMEADSLAVGDGFYELTGLGEITSEIVNAQRVRLYVKTDDADLQLYVDNVSLVYELPLNQEPTSSPSVKVSNAPSVQKSSSPTSFPTESPTAVPTASPPVDSPTASCIPGGNDPANASGCGPSTNCCAGVGVCTGGKPSTRVCQEISLCGNGVVDAGEECDGSVAETCTDLGFVSGALGCSQSCLFDTTNCSGGDGGGGCPLSPSCGYQLKSECNDDLCCTWTGNPKTGTCGPLRRRVLQ